MEQVNHPDASNGQSFAGSDSRVNSVTGERPTLTELRQYVGEISRVLYVRRWLFFVPICVVMTGSFVMSLRVPRRYQATTTFERRDDPVLVNLPSNEGSGAFATYRKTLEQDVTNIESLAEVVRAMRGDGGAETDPSGEMAPAVARADASSDRRVARGLAGGLQVRVLQESEHLDVIQIQYTSGDPDSLTSVLNEVRDKYIAMTQGRITGMLRRTQDWFEAERRKRAEVVEALEDDLIEYRTQHHGLDPLDPNAAISKLQSLRSELLELQRAAKELDTQIAGRKSFIQGSATAPGRVPANLVSELGLDIGPPDAGSRRRAEALRTLTSQIDDLKTLRGMTERHPDVLALVRKRERLAAALDERFARERDGLTINGVSDPLKDVGPALLDDDPLLADRARADMEAGIFENLLEDNREEASKLQREIAEYEVLQREAFVRRKEFSARVGEVDRAKREFVLYQGYADQVGRVLAAENSQRGILFGRISPARGGSRPVSPRLSTVIVLALTFGLSAGILLVLIAEIFDRTVRTRRQVTEGLGLPILESIGEIVSTAVRRKRVFAKVCIVPAVLLALTGMVGVSGSMAYLNLTNRDLYERAIQAPRSALQRIVTRTSVWTPIASWYAYNSEQRS